MSEMTAAFGNLSNSDWLEVLKRSVREPFINGVAFPRFPHGAIQLAYNGSMDEEAMTSAHMLWLYAQAYAELLGFPLKSGGNVLDVGCGWGRVTRTFMRDVDKTRLSRRYRSQTLC